MTRSYRARKGSLPFSVSFPRAQAHVYPCHGMSKAKKAVPLLLWPGSLQSTWDQKGALKVATLCCWALRREGLKGAHSRDFSGWVCPMRPQEEPSTCPWNAGGYTCPLPPPACSPSMGTGQGEGTDRAPFGKKGILFSGLNPAGGMKAHLCG